MNTSPDLRFQIEANPELWPREGRRSPLERVILTGAEVDQVFGLLLLREFHSFQVHSTSSIRRILTEDNSLFGVLSRFAGQVRWCDIAIDSSVVIGETRIEILPMAGSFPGYVAESRVADLNLSEANVGLLISSESTGGTLAFMPSVGSLTDAVVERVENCDVVLFDGTFWSDTEPGQISGLGRTSLQVGHLPISGQGGSLERLARLTRPRKLYIHINNTNPILDEESEEYRKVRDSGWEVAQDGVEITL